MSERIVREITSPSVRFDYEQETKSGTLLLRCHGAFSFVNYERLNELVSEVTNAPVGCIVMDMRDVVYIDSMGVGILAVAFKHTVANNKKLVLIPSQPVRVLLETSHLLTAIPTAASLEEVLGT